MNYKIKIISVLLWAVASYFFVFPAKVGAISEKAIEIQMINHARNHEKAKKWAIENYQSWKKKLAKEEEQSLERLLDLPHKKEDLNFMNINHQLKVYGGDLSARPSDTTVLNKNLQDHVDRINRAINRKEGELDKPLIVYKNETLKEVLHIEDQSFRNHDRTLNIEKVNQFKHDFSKGLHSEFRVYDLFEDISQTSSIKWKIELPIGTQTGLIGEDKIVIHKDSAFKVNEIKIIPQKGKQLIRVDAKIIPKEIVTHEIQQITDQLQHDFAAGLNLPLNKKFIDFTLTGAASHFIAKKLSRLLEQFVTRVDKSLIQHTLEHMAQKGGYILFTDQKIYTLPIIYEFNQRTLQLVMQRLHFDGFYNIHGNRTLAIHIPTDINEGNAILVSTLFHEFGHAVDHYGAQALKMNEEEISETPKFIEIFKIEKENLTNYAKTNPAEFFAEAFWMMHAPEQKNMVKENAPKTYAFMKAKLEALQLKEPDPV